jgi:hypothetical protein
MPDSKITALTSIGTSTDPANDPLVLVDVSDTSMAATGTTKKVTLNNLLACSPTATLASATITGDLTVDTSTLKVDSANNRVIVGHTSGSAPFQVTNAGAAGLELHPTGASSAPLIISYNRSGLTYTQLTIDASTIVHQLGGSTAMTLNSTGLGVGVTPSAGRLHIKGGAAQSPLVLDTLGYNQIVLQLNGANRGQIYADATNCFALVDSTGSNLRLVVTDTGNVGVGVTPASNTRTHFKGSSTSTDYITFCVNGSDKFVFGARNDGLLITGSSSDSASLPNAPYNLTSGSAANVYLDSQGIFYRSTSSLKYKTDIADSTRGLSDVLKLRPVTYKAKNSGDTVFGGLIAEEVDAAGLTEFVQYAPDNTPDAIHYGNMVSLLVSAIKELSAEVNALKNA